MNIQPLAYNNNLLHFQSKINQPYRNRPRPIIEAGRPNISVYVYEDSDNGIDVNDRTYDSFTGLRDKQYLLAVLNKKIEDSQITGKGISLAMFDMDNFKSVNELLGYETGDDFIKFIADSIDNTAKENALNSYRFGGEEFVVIFQNENEYAQKEIVGKVLTAVNSNSYIKAKEKEYKQNAQNRLAVYSMQTSKIKKLMNLKGKKKIYDDLRKNLITEEAKNDPYFIKDTEATNSEIKSEYLALISERLAEEKETDTKVFLYNAAESISKDEPLDSNTTKALDDYLKFQYDKSAEIFQIRKWLYDFENNNGFSITGSAITLSSNFIKDKTPMQLIGIAGESLKRGKSLRKGKGYFDKN